KETKTRPFNSSSLLLRCLLFKSLARSFLAVAEFARIREFPRSPEVWRLRLCQKSTQRGIADSQMFEQKITKETKTRPHQFFLLFCFVAFVAFCSNHSPRRMCP